MLNRRRSLRAAAFAYLIASIGSGALLAQQPETLGPPALKDFQLQGERTTPPAAEPATPAPASQLPAQTSSEPPRSTTTAPASRRVTPERSTRVTAPATARVRSPEAAAPAQVAPAPLPEAAAPAPVTAQPALPTPAAPVQTLPAPAPQSSAAPTAAQPDNQWSWLWLALPALLALAAFFGLGRRRRPARRREHAVETQPTQAPVADAPAAPVIAAVPAAPRPRLEVEFQPKKAAATDREAIVHFDLVLRNVGDADAANIRIDTRMFNASGEQEIDGFLKGPIHEHSGSPHVAIPPGETLSLASSIALPKSEAREIELQGRRLFVPVVAINVAYDWAEGGKGRTSRSWLVGREAEQPSAKMGAFRLDTPRIYRSVGQRPTKLANVA